MGFFKTVGGFVRDIVAPIGLAFIPGAGPYLAAAYSGINTGIKTGSPLAGIGSAGLSLGLSGAFKGLTEGATKPATALPVFKTTAEKAAQAGTTGFMAAGEGIKYGASSLANQASNLATNVGTTFGGIGTGISKGFKNLTAEGVTLGGQLPGTKDILPEFITKQSPGTIALGGLALKTLATPPPEPAPFVPMQPQRRTTDLSKYGYKGPLDRGEYTYADPEDIAYGRATPDSYGYLGAKEGGKIKAQGGGVMMQQGPYNPQIEAQKGTFRPTGSLVPPTAGPSISRLAQTQPMMSMSPQKIKGLAQPVAPTVPTNMPMSSPTPMMPPQGPMLPQGGGGLAPQPAREPLPEIANNAQKLIDQLPQKDISVNIDSLRQFIGMAEGGEVPGMSKQAPAGAMGPSSGLGVYNTSPNKMNEEEFVQGFLSIMPNNIVGNTVRELGLGENVGKQMYQQYKNTKEMAEGGEVNSDKTLQENAFVIPADVVGHIGDGSSDAGAQRLQSYLGMNPQQYQAGGIMAGELQGPGGGMDDLIQTSIEGKRAAAVSPQEFVVPRDIVAELGQGSYDKGSNKLYALMRNVRKTKTGTTKQPAELTRGLGQLMRTAIG
jgi:hypothetical protein